MFHFNEIIFAIQRRMPESLQRKIHWVVSTDFSWLNISIVYEQFIQFVFYFSLFSLFSVNRFVSHLSISLPKCGTVHSTLYIKFTNLFPVLDYTKPASLAMPQKMDFLFARRDAGSLNSAILPLSSTITLEWDITCI